jgi:hydroxymethylglutaryl-CoA reductase
MGIMGSVGLAQNFGALRSLVTTGIQKGHMKMHLSNLLNKFGTNQSERKIAIEYFKNKIISYSGVEKLINKIRGNGF